MLGYMHSRTPKIFDHLKEYARERRTITYGELDSTLGYPPVVRRSRFTTSGMYAWTVTCRR